MPTSHSRVFTVVELRPDPTKLGTADTRTETVFTVEAAADAYLASLDMEAPVGFESQAYIVYGRPRVQFMVSVNLDGVPGWGYYADDFQRHIEKMLADTIGHYDPLVTLESCDLPDRITQVTFNDERS